MRSLQRQDTYRVPLVQKWRAGRRAPYNPGDTGFRIFSATTALLFLVIAILPVVAAFLPAMWDQTEDGRDGFAMIRASLLNQRQRALLGNSLAVAVGTAAVSGILGGAAGFALAYLRVPSRRLLLYGVAASFLIPPHIFAVAWIDLLGTNGLLAVGLGRLVPGAEQWLPNLYSFGGVIFVLSLSYYPIVAFATIPAIRRFDWRMEEAALLVGSRTLALVHVVFPAILPSMLTGVLFVFAFSLVSFSVPSLLTVNVYTVEIYSRFSSFHDFSEGVVLALPLLLCGGAAVALLWALRGRLPRGWMTGARRERANTPISRAVVIAAAAVLWALVAVSSVLPLTVLVVRALPLGSFAIAWETAQGEMATSLVLAAASATVLCLMGFALAYRGRHGRMGLYGLSFLPFLVSGPVLGMGLIRLWNHAGPLGLVYDSFVIMILACVGRYIVFAHHGMAAGMADLNPNMEEAAVVHGIPWRQQVTGIVVPLVAPSLVGVWGLGFLLSSAELDAIILVYPPGFTTLSVRVFSLMHYGPSSTVAALCVINAIMVLAGAALAAFGYAHASKGKR